MSESKPSNLEEVFILTFALTGKEWAAVAATLKAMSMQARTRTLMTCEEPSESIAEAIEAASRYAGMINDEMVRLTK